MPIPALPLCRQSHSESSRREGVGEDVTNRRLETSGLCFIRSMLGEGEIGEGHGRVTVGSCTVRLQFLPHDSVCEFSAVAEPDSQRT